jgi:hypothetical protein
MKKYGKKLKEIKGPTPEEKLNEQIKKNKGSKKRWPEKRKTIIELRKLGAKNID